MKVVFKPKVRDLIRDLTLLASKSINNRKFSRDLVRISKKFSGNPIAVSIKPKDLTKVLFFINLQVGITEGLFQDMAFEKLDQMERAEQVHLGLLEAKEVILKIPIKGETNVRKS